jgi:peptide/nickel transport system permease protein
VEGGAEMIRYILKRTLQMIPTVFGVILITFLLFNVVGGSPAKSVLGQHAQAETLEEFDEQRGFNKPLFLGTRVKTRALEDSQFERTAGAWGGVDGVTYTNGIIQVAAGACVELPLKFELRTDCDYALTYEHRADGASWERHSTRFHGSTPEALAFETNTELRSIRLRRVMKTPFDSQLLFYFKQLARLDFGVSHSTNQRVSKLLADGIVPSLMLTVPVFIIGLITSVTLSLLCAFWRDTWVDRFFVILSVALMSINYLVYIVAGQYFLGFKLGWFPVWGFEDARFLALPVLIGVISGLGGSLRFYRTIMLDEIHRDYIRTARAKGVSRSGVLFKHVLKNAMIPIITNVVIAIPFLYTGSLLLESFFGIPGLGYLGINAINSSDVDVVRAIVLIGSMLFVVANLLTDLCYAAVDPRVKLK